MIRKHNFFFHFKQIFLLQILRERGLYRILKYKGYLFSPPPHVEGKRCLKKKRNCKKRNKKHRKSNKENNK
jgi:hypothetical protein